MRGCLTDANYEGLDILMEVYSNQIRRAWVIFFACLFSVMGSVLFVDRPASTWAHEHLHRAAVFDWLTHIVDPLRPAATIILVFVAIAAVFRNWRPGKHGQTLIAASLAILVSVEIKQQMKHFCGRTWPETWIDNNPSWIRDHAYGFHLLHGGTGWESFPSGHMTQIAALAAIIWLRLPKLRWLGVALASLVAIGLWGCNYHFVGDLMAGAFLGAFCGIGVSALICPVREVDEPLPS